MTKQQELFIMTGTVVGKSIPWKSIKGNLFTVIKFTPNACVRGNTVKANSAFESYAMLTVESPNYDTHILLPVIHSLDFLNLWRIFNEHIVESDKEVIVTYDPDKWLGKIMPHLPIMIAPKNTVKRIANISSLPTSEKCAITDSIIRYWNPPHPGRDLHATISLWGMLRRKR